MDVYKDSKEVIIQFLLYNQHNIQHQKKKRKKKWRERKKKRIKLWKFIIIIGVFNRWKAFYYDCKGGTLREFGVMANPETAKSREVFDLSGSYVPFLLFIVKNQIKYID